MKNTVLVTGVAGFIGSNLASMLLDRGFHVVGIDDLSAGTQENVPYGVEFHKLSILDASIFPLFSGVDTVFHLAAKNCLPDCAAHPLETVQINNVGTMAVLEAARLAQVRKFIYADTSAEYEGIATFPTIEANVAPQSLYAASKHGGASLCNSYMALYDMDVTIVRYFNVYGPAQDWRRVVPPVMSAFIMKMLDGNPPFIYGTGEKRRDFIFVDDINDFHLVAMTDPRSRGEVFNVGSGTNYSIVEIFNFIEELLQSGIKPVYKPGLPGEAEITLADISKARSLGWAPKIDIREGLVKSIAYIKQRVLHS
ncbi:MAG: NAD-dependent epimerase/dehydratase family protein [Terracidiphilus sp.]|jgi:UDP-glucose 4-epimerase